MKAKIGIILVGIFLSGSMVGREVGASSESSLLKKAHKELTIALEKVEDEQQKKCLENAEKEIGAAQEALKEGEEEEAKKHKRKALKWMVQATRECMDPGEIPGLIGGALKSEGGVSEDGLNRLNFLLKSLLDAKKGREKSDFPFFHDMAIQQLVLALFDLIDSGGWDGWHSQKVLKWYIEAATFCEDVQDMINELLDYLKEHADETGISDIGAEASAKAKEMIDRLYQLKKEGASRGEIQELADKIKKFLEDEYARVGKERREHLAEEKEGEQIKPREVTTVRFTALEGKTNINKDFLGEVEKIQFVAIDGKEIEPSEVDPELSSHTNSLTLSVGKAVKIGSIILVGTEGIVRLVQDREGGLPPDFEGITPKDGMIDVRNGFVKETFDVMEGSIDMNRAPQEHSLSIDETPVAVVATRPGQVAVSGGNIKSPLTGESKVKFLSPGGIEVVSKCSAWGYHISIPQITKTKTWVSITVEISGLKPADRVTFRFLPSAGQEIVPLEVTISAQEAAIPTPIARIRVEKPGAQALGVMVEKEEK